MNVCVCVMISHLPWQSDARHGDERLGEGSQLRTDLLHLQLQASPLPSPLLQTDVHLQWTDSTGHFVETSQKQLIAGKRVQTIYCNEWMHVSE